LLAAVKQRDVERLLPQLNGRKVWVCSMIGYGYDSRKGEFDYYQWLLGLGSVRTLDLRTGFFLHAVGIGEPSVRDASGVRLDRWYEPFDIPGKIEGFDRSEFSVMEWEADGATPFRWSRPRAWFVLGENDRICTVILNAALPPPIPSDRRPDLTLYARRGKKVSELFNSTPVARIDAYRPDAFEIRLKAPPGLGELWIGWTVNGVNLKRAGVSGDDRDLGLRINWVGTANGPR
jgi:hypothetical protein